MAEALPWGMGNFAPDFVRSPWEGVSPTPPYSPASHNRIFSHQIIRRSRRRSQGGRISSSPTGSFSKRSSSSIGVPQEACLRKETCFMGAEGEGVMGLGWFSLTTAPHYPTSHFTGSRNPSSSLTISCPERSRRSCEIMAKEFRHGQYGAGSPWAPRRKRRGSRRGDARPPPLPHHVGIFRGPHLPRPTLGCGRIWHTWPAIRPHARRRWARQDHHTGRRPDPRLHARLDHGPQNIRRGKISARTSSGPLEKVGG